MKRRNFLAGGVTAAAAAALTPAQAIAQATPADPDGSAVPRRVDCRLDRENCTLPIIVKRHGHELKHVVAYDLDAQWVDVYRTDPSGQIVLAPQDQWVRYHGAVTVEWDVVAIAKRQLREEQARAQRYGNYAVETVRGSWPKR